MARNKSWARWLDDHTNDSAWPETTDHAGQFLQGNVQHLLTQLNAAQTQADARWHHHHHHHLQQHTPSTPADPPADNPSTNDPAPIPVPTPAPTPPPLDADQPGDASLTSSSADGFISGAKVTAHVTDPDGLGSGPITFQWLSAGADHVFHPIAGAGSSDSYTLKASDVGKQIEVSTTYTDAKGHTAAVTADPVTVEAAPTPPVPSPAPDPEPTPTPGPTPPSSSGDHVMIGINLAGAEFGSTVPGTFNVDYTYPTHAEIDYYAGKGMEVIRLPFLWERVQHSPNGALDTAELARMDDVVNYAASKGLKVDLDMHNFGDGPNGLVGSGTSNTAFADVWGKLAAHFAADSNVLFGLMNEPNQQSATQWLTSVNAGIDAIRHTGATQEILVPGSYWDGAWTWVSSDNDTVIGKGVQDPLHNFAFEVHQYLDSDGSGTHNSVVSATVGVDRLKDVTQWAESTGNKLFLGEFGVASDQASITALNNMLDFIDQHPGAWQAVTYWAGGPWWGNYMFSAEPTSLSNPVDKPQMTALINHIEPQDHMPTA